jgi:hypothetical protein
MAHAPPAKPRRLDAFLPWMVSACFHAALGLIGMFVFLATTNALSHPDARPIIVPNSFDDPSLAEHPGTPAPGTGGDPLHPGGQDRFHELARSEGWGQGGGANVAALVGTSDAAGIFRGNGTTISPGQSSNSAAAFGTPGGGAGAGPRSSFYGIGGNGVRVVYLIDHTASLVDRFGKAGSIDPGSVKGEVRDSVLKLSALQHFAVLVFSSDDAGGTQMLGSQQVVQALPENKQRVLNDLTRIVPAGGAPDEETIFVQAFRKAFALEPQLVFFLTDGYISPNVLTEIRRLNTQHAVINTVMFTPYAVVNMVPREKQRFDVMTELARQNGGIVKVVSVSLPQ